MNCNGCGLPMTPEEMGVNFKGEKVEYHAFQAKCVELLRAENAKLKGLLEATTSDMNLYESRWVEEKRRADQYSEDAWKYRELCK